MPRPTATPGIERLVALITVVTVVAVLWSAQEVLIPLALAVLFAFLLTPLVGWLQRCHLGRTTAVLLATSCAFGVVGALGYALVTQGIALSEQLPEYRRNIRARLESLQPADSNPIAKAAETIEDIGQEMAEAKEQADGAKGQKKEEAPVPVEVVQRQTPLGFLTSTAGPLLSPLGTAGMVIVLVIFILLGREDLRDRLIHLLGRGDLHLTTQALEDASRRVSRYLLMQLCVNLIYAVPIAVGLLLIGVPNALLFALLGGALRFVPYLGPVVAAGMPILLSLAVFDGWNEPLLTIGLFLVVELIVNNVVEPWLYGSSTGMSSFAVILAALFWTWLWGPLGLLMATPLTATLVAFGKHVPQLGFLNVLFGDEPVGAPSERLYQRLLAMDHEEASEIAEESLETTGSLEAVYDQVILPALRLAEEDRHRGRLDDERSTFMRESLGTILDVLIERSRQPRTKRQQNQDADAAVEPAEPRLPPLRVLCIAARDDADELVARALAEMLQSRGMTAEVAGIGSLVSERVGAAETFHADLAVISAVPPSATSHARHLGKRLRSRRADLPIVVGLWLSPIGTTRACERIGIDDCTVVTTIVSAIETIRLRALATTALAGGLVRNGAD